MAPSVTGEGAESQVRVWPDKLSVCAPLLGRGGQEVGERCSSCTKDREQAAVLLCFWRTVRERSRCVCGGHQGTKDVILRVRGRSGGDMLVADRDGPVNAGSTLFSHAHRDGEMDGPRPVARLGIGFAESHAAPHERALGRLLSAASSAQHPPARSNSPFLYDISQRSETRASPSRPYNTFTQRAKEPPYQRVYIVFFSRPNSAQCLSYTKLRWIIYL